jgi:hypothetical protein
MRLETLDDQLIGLPTLDAFDVGCELSFELGPPRRPAAGWGPPTRASTAATAMARVAFVVVRVGPVSGHDHGEDDAEREDHACPHSRDDDVGRAPDRRMCGCGAVA